MNSQCTPLVLTSIGSTHLDAIVRALQEHAPRRGRPWALPLRRRIVIAVTSLRTNLTVRELAAIFTVSRSQTHRILSDIVARLARLLVPHAGDLRWSWIVDGTLVPTRDHAVAAKSKNYRWSCNAQLLVRRRDLLIVSVSGAGPGNRNDVVHYRGSVIERLCQLHRRVLADGGYRGVPELAAPIFRRNRIVRDAAWRRHRKRRARVEHAIARLKDWRALRDYRRRGRTLLASLQAIAVLHNLKIELRDNS